MLQHYFMVEKGKESHIVYDVQKNCDNCGNRSAVIMARKEEDGFELRISPVTFCPHCGVRIGENE